jgi:hypothetical protein
MLAHLRHNQEAPVDPYSLGLVYFLPRDHLRSAEGRTARLLVNSD